MTKRVTIVEVGPRDGLQNERALVSTADKIEFVNRLERGAHLPVIEVSAFVSPKWVPQMADAAEVFAGITATPGIRYTALVPNLAGLDRAIAGGRHRDRGVRGVDRNVQPQEHQPERSTSRSRTTRRSANARARRGCACAAISRPRSAARSRARSRRSASPTSPRGLRSSASSRSRSATPSASRIRARCRACSTRCSRACRPTQIALHFHDTRGTALANVLASLPYGIATFDASAGGLGGCPYAPGAAGNLATDDLIYMLDGLGIETGVSLAGVSEASAFIASKIDHRLPSRFAQAEAAKRGG